MPLTTDILSMLVRDFSLDVAINLVHDTEPASHENALMKSAL
jgi:hypothetical protein